MDLSARVTSGTLHGTAVALDKGRGVLLLGRAGSGKSGLALQLMAHGAQLIADDRVMLRDENGVLMARAPEAIKGKIEARGIGILPADALSEGQLTLVVDLDQTSEARVPERREAWFGTARLPLISAVQHDYFAAALLQYLKSQDTS